MDDTTGMYYGKSNIIFQETFATVILNSILTYVTLSTDVIDHWFYPVKRGFYCFDETLSKPLYTNTVPTKTLLVLAVAIPALVIIVTELCTKASNSASKKIVIFKAITDGFFGLVCVCLLTNITKYVTGRLR